MTDEKKPLVRRLTNLERYGVNIGLAVNENHVFSLVVFEKSKVYLNAEISTECKNKVRKFITGKE